MQTKLKEDKSMNDTVNTSKNFELKPKETVAQLDRYIIGQDEAKKAVAVALRNRWRRQQLEPGLREEVLPKNILMIGPTGVGKTEIARRLAKLADAPFIKIEATKFTEVGYVGRDVESIIRDLMDVSMKMTRDAMKKSVKSQAEIFAEERIIDVLVGDTAGDVTRQSFRTKIRAGELDDKEIEIKVPESQSSSSMPTFDVPGMPGAQMGMINLGDILGKSFGEKKVKKKMPIGKAFKILAEEEADKLLDEEKLVEEAIYQVEQNAIVFLDEVDKIAARSDQGGRSDVSREGVQRDLLPLIEGTTVSTKYGMVKTDHILFIASGAFHYAKPSDLLPELQGRLPIRVELNALTRNDFKRILTETEASLVKQYVALLGTENVTLEFGEDAIDALAELTVEINSKVENIGARRLHTVMERLLEEISFEAPERSGETLKITGDMVREKISTLADNADLSKFIL